MPYSAPHRCGSCKQLVRGRCPTCDRAWSRKPKSWTKGAGDSQWRKLRAQRLEIEPLCRACGNLADTVDHVDGTDYETQRYDLEMTRSLCTPCHRSRTAAQGNEARRRGGR